MKKIPFYIIVVCFLSLVSCSRHRNVDSMSAAEMKSFEEKAQELMQSHPNEVRNMAKYGNKYERAMAEIILETVGEQSNVW